MPFLPLPPRTVGAWGRKRFVGEFHTRGGHTALCCCLISSFYIKPQLASQFRGITQDCLISSFYIKPQHSLHHLCLLANCLISSFYIKPQHFGEAERSRIIVLYRLSTSNHNLLSVSCPCTSYCLISSFYIKPQLSGFGVEFVIDCLISSLYIKPQPFPPS